MARLFAWSEAWVVAAVAIATSCAPTKPKAPRPPTAAEIVATMVSTYQRASSYEDHGTVVEEFIGSHTRHADFDTLLVRSTGFRYDVRDEWGGSPAVFWTSGGKLHSLRRGGAIQERESLGGARFYSAIPSLLLPAYAGGPTLANLKQLRVAPSTEPVDGRACWKVTGTRERGGEMTLWIDQSSHLLRKTVLRDHVEAGIERPAFDTEVTTDYRPVLDGEIAVARLEGPAPQSVPAPRSFPWIGVEFAAASTRITRLLPGAPGERAGLQVGDEVVSIDGVAVADPSAFISQVQRKSVGASAAVVVRRTGKQQTIAVSVGDRTDSAKRQLDLLDKPAPAFSATAVTGSNPASLAGLSGSLIVLDFTPPTFVRCVDCETPEGVFMSKLQDKYGAQGVRVVGLSSEDPGVLKKTAADLQLTYTLAHDDDGRAANAYMVQGPMTVFVIDKAGIVRFVSSRTGLEELVEHVLTGR